MTDNITVINDLVECGECNDEFIIDDILIHNDINFCTDCYDNIIVKCDDCDEEFNSNDGDDITTATGHRVCGDCVDDYNSCGSCGDYYHIDDITHIDNSTYCESCRDDDYSYCNDCGEWIENQYVEYIDGDMFCDACRSDRFSYCEDCDDEYDSNMHSSCPACVTGLFNNDYTPELIFHGTKTKLYLGMELEATPTRDASRGDLIDLTYELFGKDLVYLKRDGSLSEGFEIVTHPINAKEFKDLFNIDKLKNLADAGLRSWDSQSSCGIHIHFSKIAFETSLHMYAFSALMFNNPEFMQQFAGRESRYASFDDTENNRFGNNKKMSLEYAKGNKNQNRYLALNNQNSETIELRIFKGSLNTERVKCIIDFCNLLFDYTQSITVKQLLNKELTTDNMIKFCRSHSFNYSNLINHIMFRESGE